MLAGSWSNWPLCKWTRLNPIQVTGSEMPRHVDVITRKYPVTSRNPDPNSDLPISYRPTQVGFCLFFAHAGRHDALERVRKRLPIWSVYHWPPPHRRRRSGAERAGRRWWCVRRRLADRPRAYLFLTRVTDLIRPDHWRCDSACRCPAKAWLLRLFRMSWFWFPPSFDRTTGITIVAANATNAAAKITALK